MERVDPISWCWHCYSRYFQPKTQSEAILCFCLGIIVLYNILASVFSINLNLYLYLLLVSKGRRLWDAVNHGLRWCIDRRWSAQIWASHSFWVLLADNEPSMLLYFRNILLLHQTDSLRILITDLSHSRKFSGVQSSTEKLLRQSLRCKWFFQKTTWKLRWAMYFSFQHN